jgi:hypothetical protein
VLVGIFALSNKPKENGHFEFHLLHFTTDTKTLILMKNLEQTILGIISDWAVCSTYLKNDTKEGMRSKHGRVKDLMG